MLKATFITLTITLTPFRLHAKGRDRLFALVKSAARRAYLSTWASGPSVAKITLCTVSQKKRELRKKRRIGLWTA